MFGEPREHAVAIVLKHNQHIHQRYAGVEE
jgi:hypothetical protein